MNDDGYADTLERPVQKPHISDDAPAVELGLEQDRGKDAPAGNRTADDDFRFSDDQGSAAFKRLKAGLRAVLDNAQLHFVKLRIILRNRRARRLVGVPALPAVLKFQNIAALLLALCGIAMVFLDHSSPIWARQLPVAYHNIFEGITDIGKSDWILFPTGLWILAMTFGDWQRLRFRRKMILSSMTLYGAFLFFVVAVSGLLAILLKWNIGRARPILFDEKGPMAFDLFAWQAKFSSLPSGHSTTAGALIVALALLAPRYRWLFLVAGSWVAMSRIIVGAHYPSDVIAGLVVGGAFSYLCARWMARRRLGFKYARDGKIVPTGAIKLTQGWRAFVNADNARTRNVYGRSHKP
ncbi:phosphatidylglycerophosphatase B [Pseudovibrio axinellae]|uniref:Phosphatidylglycerophosphatase B n=1 Tax=Pseudovibrio axinellae TaxID=989403 RepID=A0A161VC92_9HYPH|nr:phosphatase PAP2 family protein [Pseudovibrio axinellae]KZL21786.1 phosphatidylglycerophosphatase B [Pseudovibrio axinellae]SEQ78529.1 undecaprenyl-diphosphatase [Pseudovibrio axinellae]